MDQTEKNMLDRHQSEHLGSNPSFAPAGDLGRDVPAVK